MSVQFFDVERDEWVLLRYTPPGCLEKWTCGMEGLLLGGGWTRPCLPDKVELDRYSCVVVPRTWDAIKELMGWAKTAESSGRTTRSTPGGGVSR